MTIAPTTLAGTFPAKVPIPSDPFVNQHGIISKSWLYFFIQLWNRTGAGGGGSIAMLEEQINALFIEEAMSGMPVVRQPISVGEAMGAPPAANLTFLALLADTLTAAPKPTLNPFLSALMVG